jgi:probable rRNA maturation factor
VPKNQLRQKTSRLLKDLGVSPAELSILLVDDRQIHKLNKKWRSKDRPTDVLAFAQREGQAAAPDDPVLGDIVISIERASAQAAERGHSREKELDLLLVHGLLHLLGYEHEGGGKRAQKMRAQEKKLLSALKQK